MTNILIITASIFGEDGQSSQLVKHTLEQLRKAHGEINEVHRDLAADPVPHLDASRFAALMSEDGERSADQQQVVDYSDSLIQEIKDADIIVLGVPMYNLGIPSVMKAYFDHIGRSRVTFRYTENGPVGLLEDRPVYILAARGGIYAGTALDSQTAHVTHFLGLLGLKNVQFVYAEGLNMGDEKKASAMAEAGKHIEALTA